MTKQEIIQQLSDKHQTFANLVASLNDADFLFAPAEKWTAGQQIDHIVRSVTPVANVLKDPQAFFKLSFGKADRPSCDYHTLVQKYQEALTKGGKASGRFLPQVIASDQKQALKAQLLEEVAKLCSHLDNYTEGQLDEYILPHPLLGNLTIREMLYFTIYHVEHHQKATLRNLEQ